MIVLQLTHFREILARWNKKNAIPLNIPLIDETVGGLLPGSLHVVRGESGVGKTWFCLRAILCLFQQDPNVQVLYSDFSGHLRFSNLKKICLSPHQVDQITIFQPSTLLEQIIFFRNLLEKRNENYHLIILDTVFGSPINALQYFHTESKMWKKQIFSHLLDLKMLAQEKEIPILLTNHSITSEEGSFKQYGHKLLEPFVPLDIFIRKTEQNHLLELRLFQEMLGSADFILIPSNVHD